MVHSSITHYLNPEEVACVMTLGKHLWLPEQGISDICEQVPLLLSEQDNSVNAAKTEVNILAKCMVMMETYFNS